MIDPQYVDKNNIEGMYSRDITIRNNTIKTFDNSILVAYSVDGLTFENNTIIQTDKYKAIFPNQENIQIVNCNNVAIKDNTFKRLDGKEATIKIDKKSTNVKIDKKNSYNYINSKK